jgi:hypothetical protein
MEDYVFTVGIIGLLVASVAVAVDAIRHTPLEWDAILNGQTVRFLYFLCPILAFLCFPAGIVLVLYYPIRIRPALANRRQVLVQRGMLPPTRRVIGFGSTWRDLSPWHKVKVVLAAIAALVLEVAVWTPTSGADDIPFLGKIILLPITYVAFFIAAYLGLWFAQIFIPLAWRTPDNVTPRLDQMRGPATTERNNARRAEEQRRAEDLARRQAQYREQQRQEEERRRRWQ